MTQLYWSHWKVTVFVLHKETFCMYNFFYVFTFFIHLTQMTPCQKILKYLSFDLNNFVDILLIQKILKNQEFFRLKSSLQKTCRVAKWFSWSAAGGDKRRWRSSLAENIVCQVSPFCTRSILLRNILPRKKISRRKYFAEKYFAE